MYSTLYCSRWAASSRATIKAVCHQWVLKYRECFWLTLSVNMEGRRDGNASYASHSQHSGPLRQRHQRRGPCWRLAVAATPAADPAATCRWLLVLQRAFSPPSSKSQKNVPAMFMSHSLLLFYSYGFAVEFIDDCFSLCSNPQWKIICLNSVWKYLWVWWALVSQCLCALIRIHQFCYTFIWTWQGNEICF